MTQPEGTVAYGYDVNGYMDSLTDWRGDTITMINDPDGRMETVARSNNVDTNYGYDLAGRLTSIGHTAGATVIDSFTYSLDGNGNRIGVTSNAGAESYTLDGLNRITAATYPGAQSETFTYDPAGNRTSHTAIDGTTTGYTVDDTGQLISDTSGTTYDYDQAGNLLATSDGDSYVYDDYSRATEITAAGVTETYTYDARDVRATVDGVTQLWDRNGLPTLIETGDGNNFIHHNGIARDGDEWLLADALGSVRATVDQAGNVSAETAFTAYGEPLTGEAESFGFAGEQLDTTGLVHLRARQYNPSVGRFTTVDPVQPGAPGTTGYNLYTYAANNPTTWTDPTGQTVSGYKATLEPSRTSAAPLSAVGLFSNSAFRLLAGRLLLSGSATAAIGTVTIGAPGRLPSNNPNLDVVPPEAPQPGPPRTLTFTEFDSEGQYRESECHARAAEAAALLPAQAWATWFGLNSRSRSNGRNVATVSYCINGHFGTSSAVSGLNPPSGTIPFPDAPQFPAGIVNGNLRDGDAEFKIANQLYAELGAAKEPSIAYVFSLIEFCSSCEAVLNQYSAESGVVVVPWDGGIPNGDSLSTRGSEFRRSND